MTGSWAFPRLAQHAAKIDPEDLQYFAGASSGSSFVEMADVLLLVQGHALPVHSDFLAHQFRVLSDLFAATMLPDANNACLEILKDELLSDVQLVLRVIYSWGPPKAKLRSADEALNIAEFAHKYDSPALLSEVDEYLAELADPCILTTTRRQTDGLLQPSTDMNGALYWVVIAEKYQLTQFLARCEVFVMQHISTLYYDPRMANGAVSPRFLCHMIGGTASAIGERKYQVPSVEEVEQWIRGTKSPGLCS